MCSTTVDRTSPSGLCAAPQWTEHLQMLYAQHRSVIYVQQQKGYNISKWSMRSTTVDRTYPRALCAAPQWIEHLQVPYTQHHSG